LRGFASPRARGIRTPPPYSSDLPILGYFHSAHGEHRERSSGRAQGLQG
jgi:hypothetical protein